MSTRRWAAMFGAAALCAAPSTLAAPSSSYGFGSRATALAGAVTADAVGAASLFYNPAQLCLAPSSQLLLGYRSTKQSLEVDHRDAGAPDLGALEASVLGKGAFLGVPVAFGLGLALTNGRLSRASSLRDTDLRWVLRDAPAELFDLSTALSARPLSSLSLGVGMSLLATTRGSFRVSGDTTFADGQGSEYDSQLRHSVDTRLLSARSLVLGAELHPSPAWPQSAFPIAWSLGFAFRDQATVSQELTGDLSGNVDAGFVSVPVRYSFQAVSVLAFRPRQWVLGASLARGAWRANLDLGFEQWSRYPSPIARSGARVDAEVPAGLPLGLPPATSLPKAASSGFHDRLTSRVGLERTLLLHDTRLALRVGYAYLPSPAPRSSSSGSLVDTDEHVFSIGGGVQFARKSRAWPGAALDAHALYGHAPNRRLERAGATVYAKGHAIAAGLTLTLAFGGTAEPAHGSTP